MNYLTYLLIDIAWLFQVDISQGKHKVVYHGECPFECQRGGGGGGGPGRKLGNHRNYGNSAYENKERQTQMQI